MIPLRKTTAILTLILCGGLVAEVPAQTDSVSLPPGYETGHPAQTGFVGPRGLSEEARRSFTEIPPGNMPAEEAAVLEELGMPQPTRPAPPLPSGSAPTKLVRPPEYIIEPPDLVIVEVLEALPGRPISGERLVRPDGRISLGFYGEVRAAGLTLTQLKERIALHLRKYISDETLGLLEYDETGQPRTDARGRLVVKDPRETDRVFVDVTAYNSHAYYVLGDVLLPGKLPFTGGDTVLDALQYAGGLLQSAEKDKIRLIRSFPEGSPARVLPIDYEQITIGTDSSTNYAILPNDRLVVPGYTTRRRPSNEAERTETSDAAPRQDVRASRSSTRQPAPELYFNRPVNVVSPNKFDELKGRIDELEKKVDRLVEMMEKAQEKAEEPADEAPSPPPGPPSASAPMNPFEETESPEPRPSRPGPRPPRPRRTPSAGGRPTVEGDKAWREDERPVPPPVEELRNPFDDLPPQE